MAPSADAEPRSSAEFVESSVLEVIVPSDPGIDIGEGFEGWNGSTEDESSPLLPFISQRQLLLLDEIVPLYVVFRTPFLEQSTLQAYLSRLAINLEAFVFSTAPPPEPQTRAPPPKEVLYSETIKGTTKPLVIQNGDEANPHTYVLWKLDVFICRPRERFHRPAIYFQPTASLKPAERTNALGDEYLPSRVPTALNLLQPFDNDPALAGVHPRLSALRINKIAPSTPVAKELFRPIRTGQRRLFRALSALNWRLKYSKIHTTLSDASLLVSLDVEIAHVPGATLTFENIHLALQEGSVQPLSDRASGSPAHKPGDQITCLYRLIPNIGDETDPSYASKSHTLSLKLQAKVLLSNGSPATIDIRWKTPVDFRADHNPEILKAAHRLSSPGIGAPKPHNPDALPQDGASQQGDGALGKGINVVLTVSGPPQVHTGDIFFWEVFIVNRSEKTRKLAVLVLPKRKRDYEKHTSRPSTASAGGHHADKKDLIASAVVDENIVYAKQKHARTEVAELVCLTTDVRVGHLAPGACYTAELKFVALSSGVLGVDAVRVVDLATQEAADIRDLPSVIAVEKAG